jgi:hypothetical protein
MRSRLFGQRSWSFDRLMRIGDVIKVPSCALVPSVSCWPVENRGVWKKPQRHSIQWHHPESPRKKKILCPRARSWSVFRDCWGVIIGDAKPRGETINLDAYIRMLTELKKRFKPVRPHTNPTQILRQPMPTGGGNEAGKNYRGPNMLHNFYFCPFRLCWEKRGIQKIFFHRRPNHFSAALASE